MKEVKYQYSPDLEKKIKKEMEKASNGIAYQVVSLP